jgi:hypothetical protein
MGLYQFNFFCAERFRTEFCEPANGQDKFQNYTKIQENTFCKLLQSEFGMCCNFVVELKVGVDDRKVSSSQRTDRE